MTEVAHTSGMQSALFYNDERRTGRSKS